MFYFASCSIIWGLTWIAIQYQFHAVNSNVAVFYRFITASLLLFIFCKIGKVSLKYTKKDHINFAAQGFFMFFLNYQMTYWASHLAPSALVALAFTALIYFNLFGGKIFLNLPIEKKVLWGALVSFIGMSFVTVGEMTDITIQATSALGFGISLIATISASAGNLIAMQSRKQKIPIAANNAWGMLYGCLFSLILCLVYQRSFVITQFDTPFILSFFYLTVFGTIISFGAYLKLIERMGPAKAAFTSVISPVIALTTSVYFENLHISFILGLGIFLCLLGNLLALVPSHYYLPKKYAH